MLVLTMPKVTGKEGGTGGWAQLRALRLQSPQGTAVCGLTEAEGDEERDVDEQL